VHKPKEVQKTKPYLFLEERGEKKAMVTSYHRSLKRVASTLNKVNTGPG